jgi:hypothetical protein
MKLIVENLIKHKKRPIIFSREKPEPKTNEPLVVTLTEMSAYRTT